MYDASNEELLNQDAEFGEEFDERDDEYLDDGEEYDEEDEEESGEEEYEETRTPAAQQAASKVTVRAAPDGLKEMQSLQSETNVLLASLYHQMADQQTSAHAAAVRAQKLNSGVITKEVHLMINSSLNELNSNPSKAKLKISKSAEKAFPERPVPLVGISVKSHRSSFPVSFVLTAPQLGNIVSNTVVTQSGKKGLYVIPGKDHTASPINEAILTDSESNFAREFRQKFPKTTLQNVEDGITYNSKKVDGLVVKQALIPPESCVASQIVQSRMKNGVDHKAIFKPELGKFLVDQSEATLAINKVKDQLQTQVRSVNLNEELVFDLERAVLTEDKVSDQSATKKQNEFINPAEIEGLIKSGNVENELKKNHHLYLTLFVKYIQPDGEQ